MNIGDIVKITDKRNPNMWCSGIVIIPENRYMWATVKTMHDDKWVVEGYDYDIEVVGTVEPESVGSVYTDALNVRWTKFTDDECRKQWISEYGNILDWSEITKSRGVGP